jgi:hypothetical protein
MYLAFGLFILTGCSRSLQQVKVNGFGAVVAALTDYRTGLLFSANELQPLSKELVCHSPLPRPPVQEYARQEDAQLLAVMEPFVAKVRVAYAHRKLIRGKL